MIPTAEQLTEAGFSLAAQRMEQHKLIAAPDLRQKLRIAFEFYRVITPEHIKKFNRKLKRWTIKSWVTRGDYGGRVRHFTYDQLHFCRIEQYEKVPPPQVIEKLMEAKKHGCFDYFEIATVQTVAQSRRLPDLVDPLLLGRINESENCYFIAQWDDDVKIEDILKEGEG